MRRRLRAGRSLTVRLCVGHRYRVFVPHADFGGLLFPGGQARFTEIHGGDGSIFDLPSHIDPFLGAVQFEFEIGPDAIGGLSIAVDGLEVRMRAPGRTCTGTSEEEEDDDDESDLDLDEEPPWLQRHRFDGAGGAGGSAGLVV